MSMAVGGKKGALADINITPMIDVLLVLIIIFMVITPLTPRGLETLVPQPTPPNQKQDQSDQRTVVIQVEKDHSMKINQEETTYTRSRPWAHGWRTFSRRARSEWCSFGVSRTWNINT